MPRCIPKDNTFKWMFQCNTRLSLKQSPIATKVFCRPILSVTICHLGTTLRCPNKLPFNSSHDKPHLPQTTFSQPHDKLGNQSPNLPLLKLPHYHGDPDVRSILGEKFAQKGMSSTPPYGVNVFIDSLGRFDQHPH